MANRIVSVHAETCGMGIYAIMLPSSGFSVAHYYKAVTKHAVVKPYIQLGKVNEDRKKQNFLIDLTLTQVRFR